MNHFLERGRERSQSLHGDDSIVFFRICDICHSVKHNLCYRTPWSRFGLRISFVPLRFDATRSAATSADNRRTTSPCRKVGRSVNARRAFPTSTGDLRPAAPSTATAPKLAKTVAREVPCRAPHAASRVAAPKADAKFSCLQRIEKAQNVEIFSTAEDGLGATSPRARRLSARRSICMRRRDRHRHARRPQRAAGEIFLPATH